MYTSHKLLTQTAKIQRIFAFLVFVLLSINFVNAQSDISVSKTSSSSTAAIEDQVSFTITVNNEGATDLNNVVIADALPSNTTFVSYSGSGTYNSASGILNITSIPVGTSQMHTILLEITGDGIIYNQAEVMSMDEVDVDSTPGNGNFNEDDISSACVSVPVGLCLASSETIEASIPIAGLTNIQWFRDTGSGPIAFATGSPVTISDVGTYTFTADNSVGCETGNCCPLVIEDSCFDLALTKVPVAGVVTPGDDKEFTITVYNQGDQDAYDIDITDYLPTDLTFNATNAVNIANNWALVGGLPTTTIPGPLAPGANTTVSIVLTIDSGFTGSTLVNSAEISAADNDTNSSNTASINGDGTGTHNGNNAATDEDDEDPAEFTVDQYDLALTKTLISTSPFAPGSVVVFEIEVSNEGTLDASNIEVTDVLPTGLNFITGTGFSINPPYVSTITSIPAGGAPVVLTVTAQIDNNFAGTSLTNEAEITSDDGADVDSTPDNDVATEDDQDDAVVMVTQNYDLELSKSIVTAGPYIPGNNVTYQITVSNAGTLDAANVVVTDMLPSGMNFVNGTGFSATAPHTSTIANLPAGGAPVVLTLVAQIDPSFMGTSLTNVAEITMDDGMDDDSTPDNNDPTEDDQDDVIIPIEQSYDLALSKTITSTGPYMPGDNVTYQITVTNEGSLDAANVVVTDALPAGLNFVSGTGFSATAPHTSTIASLPAGGTPVVLTLVAQIDPTFTGASLTNLAEITSDDGMDEDSTPDNNDSMEDDQDEVPVTVTPIFDLALTKTSPTGPYVPGDTITFSIFVTNQGTAPAYNVELTDYLPAGLLFDPTILVNINEGWSLASGVLTTTLAGPVNPFTPQTEVLVNLVVDPTFMGTSITNMAEISGADDDMDPTNSPPVDIDSTPDTDSTNDAGGLAVSGSDNSIGGDGTGAPGDSNPLTDEDDADPRLINITQTYDLALSKSITSAGPYMPGDNVTYQITVTNEGTLDAANVVVTDALPAGLNFVSGTGFSATAPHTSTIASLPAGGTPVVLTLVAQIDPTFTGTSLTNVAEITSDNGMDEDSSPDNNDPMEDDQDEVPVTVDPIFDLAITKVALDGPYDIGDPVLFNISVFNQGTADAYNIELTDYLPAGLNFDATHPDNITAGWTLVGGVLSTSIAGPISPFTDV